jgi:hypothetical protein
MLEESEKVPMSEVKKLAQKAIDDNNDVMNALAGYDKREEGVMTAQPVGQYFTIRQTTGRNYLYSTGSVDVIETSITHNLKTEFVKAD